MPLNLEAPCGSVDGSPCCDGGSCGPGTACYVLREQERPRRSFFPYLPPQTVCLSSDSVVQYTMGGSMLVPASANAIGPSPPPGIMPPQPVATTQSASTGTTIVVPVYELALIATLTTLGMILQHSYRSK